MGLSVVVVFPDHTIFVYLTVNILKFGTLVACQNGLDKQADPDQTASEESVYTGSSLFAILASILVNSSPDNQHFY